MKKTEKGFTLLEAVVALILFALLLQSLLNFFSQMYVNSKYLENRSYLVENARAVNDFIQEKIRAADGVEIEIVKIPDDPANPTGTITPIVSPLDNISYEGRLVAIKLKDQVGNTTSIAMQLNPVATGGKGKYRLVYTSGATSALISDMVENIKVKRDKNSDIVEFTCSFNKRDELVNKLKVEEIFTETLAYKNKY